MLPFRPPKTTTDGPETSCLVTAEDDQEDQQLLLFGGASHEDGVMNDLWLLDPSMDSWYLKLVSSLIRRPLFLDTAPHGLSPSQYTHIRTHTTMTGNGQARILHSSTAENLDIPSPRYEHSAFLATQDSKNYMFLFGGSGGEALLNDLWKLDLGMFRRRESI